MSVTNAVGGAVTPYWFKVLLIFGVAAAFAFWLLMMAAMLMSLRPWFSMNANRAEAATFFRRLIPFWYLKDEMLTAQGRLDRAKMLFWMKRFFLGAVGLGVTIGALLTIGFSVASRP